MKKQLHPLLAAAVAFCLAVPAAASVPAPGARTDQPEQQAKAKKSKPSKSSKASKKSASA